MLRLSTSDVDLLEAALHTLLSPLAYDRIEHWADAVLQVFQPLFQFDQALFGHALGGTIVAQGYGDRTAEAARTYAEHFWTVDPGMTELRKIRHLEVYHRDDIYDRHAQNSAEIFADWCTPNKLLDPAGMSVDLGMVYPAALHIYHDTESHRQFGKRGLALLRLLLPAYKAGVLTAVRFQNRSATLLAQIDDAAEGLALAGIDGGIQHCNRRLTDYLANDAQAAALRREIASVAGAAAAIARGRDGKSHLASPAPPVWHDVQTRSAKYRLRAVLLGPAAIAADPVVIVAVERLGSAPISNTVLAERYRLTPREIQVARRIADGMSNAQLGSTLGIRPATARRHTERVYEKLGVHSRAQVAAMLSRPTEGG